MFGLLVGHTGEDAQGPLGNGASLAQVREGPWFVQIKGRVDRADVDADGRLHVYDYKSGRAPEASVTLQVPLYSMCLSQDLGTPIEESVYLSFRDRRSTTRADYQKASALLVELTISSPFSIGIAVLDFRLANRVFTLLENRETSGVPNHK